MQKNYSKNSQKKHKRRTFLKLLGGFFLMLALPSCKKVEQPLAKSLPYHHLPDGTFRNLPGAPIRDEAELEEKGSPFGFFRVMKSLFKADEKVVVPAKYSMSEKNALEGFYNNSNPITVTWLGHAAFLIKIGKLTILTDPFLSSRAGVGIFGPKRFNGPAISIENLPKVDLILISHSHYDHLDSPTLKAIKNKSKIKVITPLQLGKTLQDKGYDAVQEMDWYQTTKMKEVNITFLPAAHWSRRLGQSRNTTLWGGYLLELGGRSIYFSGDTAYGKPIFEHIAERINPPDLGIIPIGAYKPRWFMKASHTTPEEAVQIGLDLKCKKIVGMHWGSIRLSTEDLWEPPERFKSSALKFGFAEKNVWVIAMGETKELN